MAPPAGPDRSVRVGVDIGGTKCLGVAIDTRGEVLASHQLPTTPDFDALVETIAAVVGVVESELGAERRRAEASVRPRRRLQRHRGGGWWTGHDGLPPAVGVGLPGLIDAEGRMHATPHLSDPAGGPIEARRLLAEALGRPVVVDNDANCAAIAEWTLGTARGIDDVVMVTLGTGIGGAVIADGRLHRGAHGFAGELGHMLVDPDGPPCPCGRRGCWERYASGQGLQALGRAAAEAGSLRDVLAASGGRAQAVTGEAIEAAARTGDVGAIEVIDQLADWVAVGLSNLTNALDPALFVIGGGLADMDDLLAEPIRRHLATRLYSSQQRPLPEIRFAALRQHAGAIGAALVAAGVSSAGEESWLVRS